MSIREALLREVEGVVGKENLLTSAEDLACYSYDATPLPSRPPEAVALPGSAEQVVRLIALASNEGLKVIPRGAGTNLSGGTLPVQGGLVLCLTRMNRILELDRDNMTVTVEPGVVTSALHAAVESRGLFYPPDPASMNVSTIGGNVGECAGGLRGRKYGVTKDYVLGLEMVLPSGEVLVTGGKTVKNVAGYDLTRLMVGSEGTLGVFTRIILKLIPMPEGKKTMLALYDSLERAASTVSSIIAQGIVPSTLEFMDRVTVRCVADHTGVNMPRNAEAVLLIEVDGPKAAIEGEAARIVELCSREHALEVRVARDAQEGLALTLARRAAIPALARLRPTIKLEDITVPPSKLPEMIAAISRAAAKHQVQVGTFGHAGDGNLHPTFLTDQRDAEEMKRVEATVKELFETAISLGGTISGEHGIGLSKIRYLPLQVGPSGMKVMRAIKTALDPKNLFNPGKIFLDSDTTTKP